MTKVHLKVDPTMASIHLKVDVRMAPVHLRVDATNEDSPRCAGREGRCLAEEADAVGRAPA